MRARVTGCLAIERAAGDRPRSVSLGGSVGKVSSVREAEGDRSSKSTLYPLGPRLAARNGAFQLHQMQKVHKIWLTFHHGESQQHKCEQKRPWP